MRLRVAHKKQHVLRMITQLERFEQLPGDFLSEGVLPALFHPGSQAAEAGWEGDIINKEYSMDVTIVVLHHGLSETLLSCCVPQLELVVREAMRGESVRQTCTLMGARWLRQKRGKEEINEWAETGKEIMLKYLQKQAEKHAQRQALSHH